MPVIKLTREVKIQYSDEVEFIPAGTVGELDSDTMLVDFLWETEWYQRVLVEEGDYVLLDKLCTSCVDGYELVEGALEDYLDLCDNCKGWGWAE